MDIIKEYRRVRITPENGENSHVIAGFSFFHKCLPCCLCSAMSDEYIYHPCITKELLSETVKYDTVESIFVSLCTSYHHSYCLIQKNNFHSIIYNEKALQEYVTWKLWKESNSSYFYWIPHEVLLDIIQFIPNEMMPSQ